MDDLIRRGDVLKFPIRHDHYDKEHGNKHFIFGIESVIEYVEEIPAVDAVEVRHGKFIHDGPKFDGGVDWYHCSVCLAPETGVYVSRPYCSWCGARMDGQRREDGEKDV